MLRSARVIPLLVCLCWLPQFQSALAQPSIYSVDQLGLRRGQEVDVTIEGEGLGDIYDVVFYDDALRLKQIVSTGAQQCVLKLSCDGSAGNGEHAFRLVSPAGVSQLHTLQVGPFRALPEQEPNSNLADAQVLPLDVTIEGVVSETDADYFQVTLQAGQRLSVEVEALRLGRVLFDAKLSVLDSAGNQLVEVDDCAAARLDPVLSMVAAHAGDYFVRVQEAAFGGDDESKYRLHIGSHARPTVAYPAGAKPGSIQKVELLGDAAGPIPFEVDLQQTEIGMTSIVPNPRMVAPIKFRATHAENTLEQEPNNFPTEATAGPTKPTQAFALNGILNQDNDRDCFTFYAEAGQEFDAQLFGARIGSPIDSLVTVLDPAGKITVTNDDGIIHDSSFRMIARSTGMYCVQVEDHLGRGGTDFVYRLEFEPVIPKLTLKVPEGSDRNPQRFQAVVVPRGNRCLLPVVCARQNFEGAVNLATQDLPPGVTASSSPIGEDQHIGRLVFEATPDCPLGAQLIRIHGHCATDSGSVSGELDQQVGLVFGPPRNQIYHGIQTNQIPVVVVEQAPFSLQVVEPRGPLVKDGKLEVQVRAERMAGFDGEIEIEIPNLPPWIFQPEDAVVIPPGKSEVVFPLFSEEAADAQTWELVAIGHTELETGGYYCASEPFSIEVADRYVDVRIASTSTEQGVPAPIQVDLHWKREFSGLAIAKLQGLPKHAQAASQTVTPGTQSLRFTVETSAETPVSVHNTLFLELSLRENGQLVTHYLGRGSTLEVFAAGGKPRDTASRLEILRRQKAAQRVAGPEMRGQVISTSARKD